MAGTAVRYSAKELSRAARRHLWMHFTRLGADPDARSRSSSPARAASLRRRRPALPRRPRRGCTASTSVTGARSSRRRPPPDARARLLHQLELRAPARDRARGPARRARARRPEPGLLHLGRLGGRRVGAQARARLPPAHGERAPKTRSSPARSPTTAPRSARCRRPASPRSRRRSSRSRPAAATCRTPTPIAGRRSATAVGGRARSLSGSSSRGPRPSPP